MCGTQMCFDILELCYFLSYSVTLSNGNVCQEWLNESASCYSSKISYSALKYGQIFTID